MADELQNYKALKLVKAGVIDGVIDDVHHGARFLMVRTPNAANNKGIVRVNVPLEFFVRGVPAPMDYFVEYQGGYQSWLKKAAFEACYTVDDGKADGLPVKGYLPQPSLNVVLVNANKELEERVLRQLDALQHDYSEIDHRWLAIARTNIERGFMAMNRAVFKPRRIELPKDREVKEEKTSRSATLRGLVNDLEALIGAPLKSRDEYDILIDDALGCAESIDLGEGQTDDYNGHVKALKAAIAKATVANEKKRVDHVTPEMLRAAASKLEELGDVLNKEQLALIKDARACASGMQSGVKHHDNPHVLWARLEIEIREMIPPPA